MPLFSIKFDWSGLKPGTSREELEHCLDHFGLDDSIYGLMNVFEINSYDSWTILPRIIHVTPRVHVICFAQLNNVFVGSRPVFNI